jgi:hypothetical protein
MKKVSDIARLPQDQSKTEFFLSQFSVCAIVVAFVSLTTGNSAAATCNKCNFQDSITRTLSLLIYKMQS